MNQIIRHKLKKGFLFFTILVVIPVGLIFCGAVIVLTRMDVTNPNHLASILMIFIIPILLVYFFFIKTYYNSEYIIDGKLLIYKIGIFKSSINIERINYIKKGEYPVAGNRPALDLKGIKLNYGNGSSIFLSPQNIEKFISDLKIINIDIIVK